MSKTTLVALAAGMGSRFGGLKQMEPVSENGSALLDFSVFDAEKAGFDAAAGFQNHVFKKVNGQRRKRR